MQLGNKILELRKKNGLSQEEMSEKIGVTRQTISNWELGETSPNPEQLKLLSKELNISIDELLDNNIHGTLVEKVTNTEELTKKILKTIKRLVITVICIVLFTLICLFIIKILDVNKDTGRKIEENIHCKIYGEEHGFSIVYEELTGRPLELGGDTYFSDILNLGQYNNAHQIFNIINDYVKKNGGNCEMIKEHDISDLVEMQIKEGTLTKSSMTIILNGKVDYEISFSESFWIEKYNYKTSSFEKMPNTTGKNCAFNEPAYYIQKGKPRELYQDWSCQHGKLDKGLYRLVKDVFFKSDIPVTTNDINYIWIEFEIE